MKFIIVDSANIFFKSRYIANRAEENSERVGMAIHLTFTSIQSIIKKFCNNDDFHVLFMKEGRSWRKDFYKPYKAHRALKNASLTEEEVELDKLFWEAYDNLTSFLSEKTNVSVIRCENAEADDLIARFIHLHPSDEHYIISSDSDFHQLTSKNVKIYNSINNTLITENAIYDEYDKSLEFTVESNSKIKIGKANKDFTPESNWREYALFLKCIRGDTGDNIFSAYPGVRIKGTKDKVGLMEAFNDRDKQGFSWNNFLLQKWVDHEGNEHRVRDDYERNRILIDLTYQPEEIKNQVDSVIKESVKKEFVSQIGIHFMRFCGKYQLVKISENLQYYINWLNKPYNGILKD